MFCSKCGTPIQEGAKFCSHCGNATDVVQVEICNEEKGSQRPTDGCGSSVACSEPVPEKRQHRIKAVDALKSLICDFSGKGRASRSEYWFCMMWAVILLMSINILVVVISLALEMEDDSLFYASPYVFATTFIDISMLFHGIRRMHDAGESGWCLLVPIYNLVLLFQKSEPRTNKYGDIPNCK